MKIAVVQFDIIWENKIKNINKLEVIFSKISSNTNLILLPEMFTTGFSMNAQLLAETMQEQTVLWLQKMAKLHQAAIAGSIPIQENGLFYNRFLFVLPSGKVLFYDKRHLFTLAGEHQIYTAGSQPQIILFEGFKIALQVCYDLRFPVFSRNTLGYDALLYVANWPNARIAAWDALLKARAIENMAYVIGVNRVGSDAHQLVYNGHSQCVDCFGNLVLSPQTAEGFFEFELDKKALNEARKKFPFLNDGDTFVVDIQKNL
ncbi:amidohydrolase [Flavobacterium branchiophilum]|uniref:Omega-amidase YafV n=1 Tax=Flavobacterium branchiophilum TaxID=55197 RepID=A0A2H3KIB2_9FLAO|nr:amidohydrolase [Flavobacterium branchiophilum]PDS24232.1 amidohydrolase [Flavobacterium branchiophilum]